MVKPISFKEDIMFARIATFRLEPAQREQVIELVRQVAVPANQQLPGFRGLRCLLDRQGGSGMNITFWENEADLQAAADASRQASQRAEALHLEPASHAEFEVVVDVSDAERAW
jgi:heme-degrading monooxygenase HmoA